MAGPSRRRYSGSHSSSNGHPGGAKTRGCYGGNNGTTKMVDLVPSRPMTYKIGDKYKVQITFVENLDF